MHWQGFQQEEMLGKNLKSTKRKKNCKIDKLRRMENRMEVYIRPQHLLPILFHDGCRTGDWRTDMVLSFEVHLVYARDC